MGASSGERFLRPAFSQRQKGVPVTLARGNILDRNGVALHYPVWGTALVLFPSEIEDAPAAQRLLRSVAPTVDANTLPSADDPPVKLSRNPSAAVVEKVLAAASGTGLCIVPEEARYGPMSLACHVVGHIRTNAYMDSRDNVGESGLERTFQSTLAGGSPAWSGVLATAEGGALPGTGIRIAPPASVPADLGTTLDVAVQRAVEAVLDQSDISKGAAVVLDAATSQVLAMASRPGFDQNHPEESLSLESSPFVNRAISAFAPGSVFKPVIATLALEKGYVLEDEVFTCTGEVDIGGRKVSCGSTKQGHGAVTLRQALAKSCNSTLIKVGLRIPAAELVEYVKACGFGSRTGLPLSDEAAGSLPDPYGMYAGDIANTCIGQGHLSVTPLQVAAFFASIAGDGLYRKPSLILNTKPAPPIRLFSQRTASVVQEALLLGAREGTGHLAWVPLFGSSGKTGTAETGVSSVSHAWFCGWTPVIAPRYVIAVFVEEGGDGPSVAAPIFRQIASLLMDTHADGTP
jgi:peptidoglycan glycosyltransferase/penicillin-binding protein 2